MPNVSECEPWLHEAGHPYCETGAEPILRCTLGDLDSATRTKAQTSPRTCVLTIPSYYYTIFDH